MRIAWITTGFSKDENDFGGAAAIHNRARELSRREEIELVIFSLYYPVNQSEYYFYKARVFSFAQKGKLSKAKKYYLWNNCRRKFGDEHARKPFDIVHSMWAGESGYVASRICKKHKIPFIANICGGELAEIPQVKYGSRTKFWQKTFVDLTLERADKIVAGSGYIIEKIRRYYNTAVFQKTVKVPFGVDEKMFFPLQKKTPNSYPALVAAGSAVPVKAYNILLNSLRIVKHQSPDIRLIICGRDDKEILPALIKQLDLNDNVHLTGFLDYNKVPVLINSADIFVLSSLYESQNMSIIEAAFCGLPVVSTNVGIAPEITSHIAEPSNPVHLAGKIIEVINNYTDEQLISLSKVPEFTDKFSLQKSVGNFIELYRGMI